MRSKLTVLVALAAATALPSLHLGRIPVLFENDKENIIVNPTVC